MCFFFFWFRFTSIFTTCVTWCCSVVFINLLDYWIMCAYHTLKPDSVMQSNTAHWPNKLPKSWISTSGKTAQVFINITSLLWNAVQWINSSSRNNMMSTAVLDANSKVLFHTRERATRVTMVLSIDLYWSFIQSYQRTAINSHCRSQCLTGMLSTVLITPQARGHHWPNQEPQFK